MPKTAIVTGASGGIGRATVEALSPDHDVLVHYHTDREAAEAAAADAEAAGASAAVHGCDVSDPDAAEGLVEHAVDEFGRIDVLVNNAGIYLSKSLASMSIEEIDRTVAINLLGAIYSTKAALPALCERESARIVNLASTAADGSPSDPAYSASKGGMVGFTKSIAKQHTREGVFANAVSPGPVATSMFPEERRPAVREDSPIGRLVHPEEVAEIVRFFATTTCVSGRVLRVNGGRGI